MYTYSFPQWVVFFVFYCFVGWCIETTFVSVRQRKFVNRGFLSGPVIPIYGSGAIAILFVALPVRGNLIAVFFLGMLAATVLEYITGAAMEAVFKVRYWDYSQNKFNLNGHICLNTSLAWGVLSVVLTAVLHKPVESLVLRLPGALTVSLAVVLGGVMAVDFAFSLKSALDLRHILEQLEAYSCKAKEEAKTLQRRLEIVSAFTRDAVETQITEYIKSRPDGGESIQRRIEALEQFAERLEQSETVQKLRADLNQWKLSLAESHGQLREKLKRGQRSLLRNSPSMRSRKYDEQLRLLKGEKPKDGQ